jgi:hypothetical protein
LGFPAASLPSRRAPRSRKEKAWPKLEKNLGPMALCINRRPLVARRGCGPRLIMKFGSQSVKPFSVTNA